MENNTDSNIKMIQALQSKKKKLIKDLEDDFKKRGDDDQIKLKALTIKLKQMFNDRIKQLQNDTSVLSNTK